MGWRFPFRFGAREKTQDIEHRALLEYLRRGYDVESDTELYAETRVDAGAVAMIWRINKRVENQSNPRRMLESLPKWEQACTLRPAVTDTDVARRQRLSARLRGLGGNSRSDIAAAAEDALGINYVAFVEVDPDDWITYWPGLNPGPPGHEWTSNRATVGIRMNRQQLADGDLRTKRNWVIEILLQMVPAWQTFVIGVDETFLCGIGVIGQSVIA